MSEPLQFLQPLWLLALPPFALLLWVLSRRIDAGHDSPWRQLVDAELLPYLVVEPGRRRASRLPLALFGVGGVIAIVALAAPAWERLPQPTYHNPAARVLALELDQRMLASDLSPSRLERARFAIEDMLKRGRGDVFGLVAYAGDAFAVTPLTDDAATLVAQLRVLHPDLMPIAGTRPERALALAGDLLRQAGRKSGTIALIASEAGGEPALETARRLHAEGFTVSVLGVGTSAGAVGTLNEGAALDHAALEALAAAGGGRYLALSGRDFDPEALFVGGSTRVPAAAAPLPGTESARWVNRGPWLLLLLLPLAALAFRRGWLLALAWLVVNPALVFTPRPAAAIDWSALWQRPDQQAQAALQARDYARARQLAQSPALRGAADYRDGAYAAAVEAYSQGAGAEADYNRGNALARLGRLEEAIAAYDAALHEAPEFEDARFNRDLVAALLQQQQQEAAAESQSGAENPESGPSAGESGQDAAPDSDPADGQGGDTERDPSETANGSRETASKPAPSDPSAQEAQQRQADQAVAEAREHAAEAAAGERDAGPDAIDHLTPEQRQSVEQYLRRVPDDPGGLLRRKFLHQYQQRSQQRGAGDAPWQAR